MMLTFNKSFTKKIVIGVKLGEDDEFIPVIKILGRGFVGIKISYSDWCAHKSFFSRIHNYFEEYQGDELKN